MTDMRRITVSLPDEMDKLILELKKDDRFIHCSYSEIVRQLLNIGFAVFETEKQQQDSA